MYAVEKRLSFRVHSHLHIVVCYTHTHCPTMSITTSRKQRLALQFSKEKTNIVFFVFATKCSACDAQFGEEALYHRFPFP